MPKKYVALLKAVGAGAAGAAISYLTGHPADFGAATAAIVLGIEAAEAGVKAYVA